MNGDVFGGVSPELPEDRRRGWIIPAVAVLALGLIATYLVKQGDVAEPTGPPLPLDPQAVYDPIAAGAEPPEGFYQVVWRDQIEPVYQPEFTDVSGVDWPEESLVVGVAGVEEAKAYPITHLNSHEMIIDEIEGIPILVSW